MLFGVIACMCYGCVGCVFVVAMYGLVVLLLSFVYCCCLCGWVRVCNVGLLCWYLSCWFVVVA